MIGVNAHNFFPACVDNPATDQSSSKENSTPAIERLGSYIGMLIKILADNGASAKGCRINQAMGEPIVARRVSSSYILMVTRVDIMKP